MLRPRPQISYLVTTHLCWGSSALMLWAGVLSYLNHMGMWSTRTVSLEWQVCYRRWTLRQSSLKSVSKQSETDSSHTMDRPSSLTFWEPPGKPL